MTPQICLGTAQFGLDYGITNPRGKLKQSDIELILIKCQNLGINFIDTAQSYGDSEIVLGKSMPLKNKFEIINKLPKQNNFCIENPILYWEKCFQESLKKLKKKNINSFLLHNSSDLLGPYKDLLLRWLISLRERKLIKRIGVSIYEAADLEDIPLKEIQIIQLPFSLYDQRLLSDKTIEKLYNLGIAVQARSIFLQGLILQSAEKWPNFITADFKKHHTKTTEIFDLNKISMLEAAMGFAENCSFIESFLVGVSSLSDFDMIIKTWTTIKSKKCYNFDYSSFSWHKDIDLDPRLWMDK